MRTTTKALLILLFAVSYHAGKAQSLKSGLDLGENCPAFDPYHVSGPDKGTRTCPMCKYGQQQGVMIWVNNNDWESFSVTARRMELEISNAGIQKMRVFMIYMNPGQKPLGEAMKKLSEISSELNLRYVAVACIQSPTDARSAKLFKINPAREIKTTVLVYRKRKVFEKFINLDTTQLDELMRSFRKTLVASSL